MASQKTPPPPPRPVIAAKRANKRDIALDHAARLFNERGIAATGIADVAAAMQVTRAALYYYFDERDDLVFQAYERSCQLTAADLEAADSQGGDGFARTMEFARRALSPERPPIAVLSEVENLKPAHRQVIATAAARNVRALKRFIERGADDGSVRHCDGEVAAQTLMGFVSWIQLSPAWLDTEESEERTRDAKYLMHLLANGAGAPGVQAPKIDLDAQTLRPAHGNPFDREAAAAMKIETVLAAASRLFNSRGVDGVSLDDVAGELGATKGALYHYFPDKTDLIRRCYERAFDFYEAVADAATTWGATGLEQSAIGIHLNAQALAGPLAPLAPLVGIRGLPDDLHASLNMRATRLSRRYEAMGRRGAKDKTLSLGDDIQAAARAGAGLFAWIPKWRREGAPARDLADEIVRFYVRGLSAA